MNVKLGNQCKICNLIKTNEGLWVEVHTKVIEDGLPNSVVCKWLNSKIEVLNANSQDGSGITKFNNANFTNHFTNHISDLDGMKMELKRYVSSHPRQETTSFDEKQKALAEAPIFSKKDDYSKIGDMIDMMEENLVLYSDSIKKKRVDQKGIPINPREIENYSKFVSDLISAKQSLIKLRNADQVTMMAVDAVIEFIIRGMASRAIGLSDEIKSMLDSELGSETTLPDQVSKVVRARFSGEMRDLVREATDMIRKNYGIK